MKLTYETLIETKDLYERIQVLGETITKDYAGKEVTAICVLKGGVMFMADLVKYIQVPLAMDFMAVSSYGNETSSTGIVKIIKDLDDSVEGKDVLIIEDIIDSGRTLSYLVKLMQERNPNSVKICTLLDKPERRLVDVPVDYVGFSIPDEFVIGYGLDYAQKFRNLPFIAVVKSIDGKPL